MAPTTNAEAAARGTVKDPSSARMIRMGQALGNDEVQRRIDQGTATRDELLVYMSKRLGAMREAQQREEQFGDEKMRTAWRSIADQHNEEVTKPEPMRFNEAAKIYEEAAAQMCRGALSRGTELMQRAMNAERKAFEGVGKQIGVKDLSPDEEGPAAMNEVKPAQACAPCDVPETIEKTASDIQNNNTEFKDQPVKKRQADPWWTLEEEEEEEEGKPGDAG